MLIVFEGHDNVGKTRICNKVASVLIKKGYNILKIKNPPLIFKNLRDTINHENIKESLCFYLMSNLYVVTLAQSHSQKGDIILIDRYIYSTIVYHKIKGFEISNSIINLFPVPDLGFWITLNEAKRKKRILYNRKKNKKNDLFSLDYSIITKANQIYGDFGLIKIDNSGDLIVTVSEVMKHISDKIKINV